MSDAENKDNSELNDDATIKASTNDINSEDKTVAYSPASESDDDKTVLGDADETKMGELPDMGMLAIGARLEIISKDGHGEEFYITSEETKIGRSETSDIVMDFPGVSRNHFTITAEGEKFYVEDCGSKYGTYIGKNKTSGKKQIKPGDIIQAGELTLKFKTKDSEGSQIKKPLVIGVVSIIGILLLLVIFSSGRKETKTIVTDNQPQVKTTTAEISANLFKAKNTAAAGDLEGALTTLAKLLEADPDNKEAKSLQSEWQKKLLLSTKLERASKLLEAGSIEQARVLAVEILNTYNNNKMASELLQRIKKLSESKESLEVLKRAHDLVNSGNFDQALKLLNKVDNSELADEVNTLKKQIDDKKKTKSGLKQAQEFLNNGELDKAEEILNEILLLSYNQKADEIKKLIEKIKDNSDKADNLINSANPFAAKKHLLEIINLAGANNPLSVEANKKLNTLKAETLIYAHEKYQKSLTKMADGNLKDAYNELKTLTSEMPEMTDFNAVLSEIKIHLDNLARSIFRAAYVLEKTEPIKAKELWQYLKSVLPADHPYYQKATKKI